MSLKRLGFLSRSQIQRLHRLGGVRNANRILSDLSPYLHSTRLHENVYYLNAEGRRRVGANKALKKTYQIEHHVMRNSLYLALGCPADWRAEVKLSVKNEASVVCDALYKKEDVYYVVEIDNTQRMSENANKIARYRRLVDIKAFGHPPVFIWLTISEYRRKQLAKMCEGLNVHIYTVADLK